MSNNNKSKLYAFDSSVNEINRFVNVHSNSKDTIKAIEMKTFGYGDSKKSENSISYVTASLKFANNRNEDKTMKSHEDRLPNGFDQKKGHDQ